MFHTNGLGHDCSNSSALAMEFLQSCTKPSISVSAKLRNGQSQWCHNVDLHQLVQVTACLTAHYLKQCWLLIKGVPWHSPEGNFTRKAYELNLYHMSGDHTFKIIATSSRGQWANVLLFLWSYHQQACYNVFSLEHTQFSPKYSQQTPHSLPMRGQYGVCLLHVQ